MKHPLRLFAFASLGTTALFGTLVIACGDDDTDLTPTPTLDSGQPDTSTADVVTPEEDAGADADASAPLTYEQVLTGVASEICGSIARCCFTGQNIPDGGPVDAAVYGDGAVYDAPKCQNQVRLSGFEFSSVGAGAADGGTVTVNEAKARECFDRLRVLSCSLPAAELATARAACFAALNGTLPSGSDCTGSLQCGTGQFCDPTKKDAGAGTGIQGTCQPLRAQGESCDVFNSGDDFTDSLSDEEACSTRGGGDTGLRCDTWQGVAGGYLPRNQWTCQPTLALDSECNSTVQCNGGICDEGNGDFVCRTPVEVLLLQCNNVVTPTP